MPDKQTYTLTASNQDLKELAEAINAGEVDRMREWLAARPGRAEG